MPETNEVLEISQLIGLSNKKIHGSSTMNEAIALTDKPQDQTTVTKTDESTLQSTVDDIDESKENVN